jgi:glycosyltransferase involved in cell wall biosynthesis
MGTKAPRAGPPSVTDAARISAVIPSYNRAALVGRSIRSALAQTRQPYEIVLVDDGSTDDTRAVVESFGDRVIYLFEENRGVAAARNAGVRAASGDWIAFLDSDDVWLPDYLESMARAIETTSGAASFYFADIFTVPATKYASWWERCGFTIDGAFEFRSDASDWVMRHFHPMTTNVTIVSRAAYLRCGGQDESLVSRQDTHLFFRLGLDGAGCAVAGALGELTVDTQRADRLTVIHDTTHPSYWQETMYLYRDILATKSLSPEHRRVLRRRLAEAHWRASRLAWADRRLTGVASDAARSLITDPGIAGRLIARRAGSPRVRSQYSTNS